LKSKKPKNLKEKGKIDGTFNPKNIKITKEWE
jgi:hypothetical protein